jgi:hypothetical protein
MQWRQHLLQRLVEVLASGLGFRKGPLSACAKLLRSGRRLAMIVHGSRPYV